VDTRRYDTLDTFADSFGHRSGGSNDGFEGTAIRGRRRQRLLRSSL